MWNELLREGKLGGNSKTGAIRMTAKYLSIANMAGTCSFLTAAEKGALISHIRCFTRDRCGTWFMVFFIICLKIQREGEETRKKGREGGRKAGRKEGRKQEKHASITTPAKCDCHLYDSSSSM